MPPSTLTSTSNIFFLIGFMGSGKSLLSHGVSERMDVITVEMDDLIEQSAGMSINEIFTRKGEEAFRAIERQVLHDIIDQYQIPEKPVLISTGGGAPCHFDNMEVMNQAGTTIFINPSAKRLSARLEQKKQDRPLIKDKTADEIRTYVEKKLKERLPFYSKAIIQVNMIYDDKADNIEFLKDIIESEWIRNQSRDNSE
ncbi:hypothetical protein KUV50_03220 [Membranicola marinus]|uniref:Shikimate kinase n=1 Tax=Membranihabitans marinus TaxID=1227546 RepID=A0A953L600_9BACT|nr:shikimate kinase [Membranihabitans marinus]MBY5957132.1 hypothetical protein [Membranihabitans marinus]